MPKLFRKSKKGTGGPGWSAYMPVHDEVSDFQSDNFVFFKESMRDRVARKLTHKLCEFWFKYLVRSFSRAVYDIDDLDTSSFSEEQRLFPRARLLLREKFISIQFGIYLIEYTIENNVAYSHFSVNFGLTYIIHMELHLDGNTDENIDGLVKMFRHTENHLHSTLIDRQPPYLPNYFRH
jgi:hypothetical protein